MTKKIFFEDNESGEGGTGISRAAGEDAWTQVENICMLYRLHRLGQRGLQERVHGLR